MPALTNAQPLDRTLRHRVEDAFELRLGPARIAAIYIVLGTLWILLSDLVLAAIVENTGVLSVLQSVKGFAFVLVTGLLGYLLIRRDARVLRAAEQELVSANERLDELADFPRLSPNPILALDGDGRVVFVNDAAQGDARRFGLGAPSALLPADAVRLVENALEQKRPALDIEHRIDGSTLRWRLFPVTERQRVYAFGTDVSAELLYQSRLAQADKLDAMGRLSAGLAHDFRNAVTGIKAYTSALLADTPADDPTHEDLVEIDRAANRATELIHQLLALGREPEGEPEPVIIAHAVSDLIPLLRHLLPAGAKLDLDVHDASAIATIEPTQLSRILSNLVVNAGDAIAEDGEVRIAVDTGPAGQGATITVRDNGQGMAPDTLERIFDPLFTTKGPGAGTGLGLANVRDIIESLGGTIDVESSPGAGATFTIYLPGPGAAEGADPAV
jgi:signal transduction histidine kinase